MSQRGEKKKKKKKSKRGQLSSACLYHLCSSSFAYVYEFPYNIGFCESVRGASNEYVHCILLRACPYTDAIVVGVAEGRARACARMHIKSGIGSSLHRRRSPYLACIVSAILPPKGNPFLLTVAARSKRKTCTFKKMKRARVQTSCQLEKYIYMITNPTYCTPPPPPPPPCSPPPPPPPPMIVHSSPVAGRRAVFRLCHARGVPRHAYQRPRQTGW